MDFQQSRYSIDTLVQKVRSGKLALPNFQRDFVWEPREVVDLLDSVSRQWPIGSLLLLSGPQLFAFKEIDSGPSLFDSDLDLYILDGQQRVTALFHAIADVSEYCYYVNFQALLENEEEVFSWERRSKFEQLFPNLESRAKGMVALVSDIWEVSTFYEWLRLAPLKYETSRMIQLRQARLGGMQSKVYQVFAIELEQDIELEALARIFETINRKGVDLDAFELLVAKLYPSGFLLKDEWELAREKFQLLKKFDPEEKNKLEVLKLVALLVRVREGKKFSRGVRQGDLLVLDRELIKKYWNQGVDLLQRSLDLCRSEFGVVSPDLLPSWSMVLGVAGWIEFGGGARSISTWWYSSLFAQKFAQAANTKIVAHWDSLLEENMQIGGGASYSFEEIDDVLRKPAMANGLVNKGVLALFVRNGALDPISNLPLKNSERIFLRSVSEDGNLRKVRSKDRIDCIVMLSQESESVVGRQHLISFEGRVIPALISQGFVEGEAKRGVNQLLALLADEV